MEQTTVALKRSCYILDREIQKVKIKSQKCISCKSQSLQLSRSWAGPSSCMSIQSTWDTRHMPIMVTAHMQDKFNKRSEYMNLGYTTSSAINLDGDHTRICLSFPPVYNSCKIGQISQTLIADYIRQKNINLPYKMLCDG